MLTVGGVQVHPFADENVASAPTTEGLIAASRARSQARKVAVLVQRSEQLLKDLAEYEAIEDNMGTDKVCMFEVDPKHFQPGLSTIVVCSKIGTQNAERFARQLSNHKEDNLGIVKVFASITDQALIFPSPALLLKMEDAGPGLKAAVGIMVQDASLCKYTEEKKS